MSDYFNATGTIGFTCDVCGRETQGCTWVNGMKFCAKCYQETFGETDKDKQIADLKAKLEQSQKERELDNTFWKQECDSLQKALVEKDKIIIKYQLLDDNYTRLDEKYDQLESRHEVLLEENEKLEKQLADSENELKNKFKQMRILYNELYTLRKGVEYCQAHHRKNKLTLFSLHNFINDQNQAKTDFAIEQLEKVKEIMSKSDESGYIIRFSTMNDREKFNQVINQQINKLKEKK